MVWAVVVAVVRIVVRVQAPWGEGGGVVWELSSYHTPRLAWILSAKEAEVADGVRVRVRWTHEPRHGMRALGRSWRLAMGLARAANRWSRQPGRRGLASDRFWCSIPQLCG